MRLSSYTNTFIASLLLLLLLLLLLTLGSCNYFKSKGNKQDFLDSYRSFMQDVQSNYNIYDSKDWNVADEKIVDLSQNQYRSFETDLTFHEKLEIGKYPVLYHLYKYKRTVYGGERRYLVSQRTESDPPRSGSWLSNGGYGFAPRSRTGLEKDHDHRASGNAHHVHE